MEKELKEKLTEEELGGTQTPATADNIDNENIDAGDNEPIKFETDSDNDDNDETFQDEASYTEESELPAADAETPEPGVDEPMPERTFTQSQVNAMVGKARKEGRESAMKDLLSRYGVDTEDEMNEVFGRGQAYDYLNDEYESQSGSYRDVMSENALLKAHIAEDRWDDVKLILNGKGLDVNEENIQMFLPTHPEWASNAASTQFDAPQQQPSPLQGEPASIQEGVESSFQPASNNNRPVNQQQPAATLRKLGHETKSEPDTETEEQRANKLFGLK